MQQRNHNAIGIAQDALLARYPIAFCGTCLIAADADVAVMFYAAIDSGQINPDNCWLIAAEDNHA